MDFLRDARADNTAERGKGQGVRGNTLPLTPYPFSCRPVRRLCRPGIFGPGVLRIAAPQFLAHLGIRPLPEASQISRRLHRPAVRREQVKRDGYARSPDSRRFRQAEQLLELHRCRHRSVVGVVERHAAAARHDDRRGRAIGERPLQIEMEDALRDRSRSTRPRRRCSLTDERAQVDVDAGKSQTSKELRRRGVVLAREPRLGEE